MDSNNGNTPRQEKKILNSETDVTVLDPLSSLTLNEKEERSQNSNAEVEDSCKDTSSKQEKSSQSLLDELDLNLVSELVPERTIPAVNVQEKIIICLDICKEVGSSGGSDDTSFNLIKKSIVSFLCLKQKIDTRHVFALVTLGPSKARVVKEFSNDLTEIIGALTHISEIETDEEIFNLDSLFDFFSSHLFPTVSDIRKPPSFIVRLILLYNRRNCVPTLVEEKYTSKISSPYFFIDILWICDIEDHEDNKISTIKDNFLALNESGLSYMFHVKKNSMNIFNVMAKFTAHPLQRPLQNDCKYDFEKPVIEI